MAQKESQHREAVEALNEELTVLRRQYDELTALSSNQVLLLLDRVDADTHRVHRPSTCLTNSAVYAVSTKIA